MFKKIIGKIFKQKIEGDPDLFNLFLNFVKTLHDKETKNDEKTKDEVLKYAQEQTYHSIDRTQVNSRAEKEILEVHLSIKDFEKKYPETFTEEWEKQLNELIREQEERILKIKQLYGTKD